MARVHRMTVSAKSVARRTMNVGHAAQKGRRIA